MLLGLLRSRLGPVTLSFAVLRVTGSVSRLGLVLAAQATAALALTLAGGLAADRFPRARILICSLAGRTVGATLLAVTLVTGTASFPLLVAAGSRLRVRGRVLRAGQHRAGPRSRAAGATSPG